MNTNKNNAYAEYFQYLNRRSTLGKLYRRHVLYPRLTTLLEGRCIDIGCGIGDMMSFRRGTVGVDINPHTVAYCQRLGLDARLMQPNLLPVGDCEFDSALLDNVIEHLPDPRELLQEISRVLHKGGILLVGVPGIKGWAADPDHKIYYDEQNLKRCVESAGYQSVGITYMPLWQSGFLSRRMTQYCIYIKFRSVQ
jgi:SAM-dependent methyltransferase